MDAISDLLSNYGNSMALVIPVFINLAMSQKELFLGWGYPITLSAPFFFLRPYGIRGKKRPRESNSHVSEQKHLVLIAKKAT